MNIELDFAATLIDLADEDSLLYMYEGIPGRIAELKKGMALLLDIQGTLKSELRKRGCHIEPVEPKAKCKPKQKPKYDRIARQTLTLDEATANARCRDRDMGITG